MLRPVCVCVCVCVWRGEEREEERDENNCIADASERFLDDKHMLPSSSNSNSLFMLPP